MARRREALKRMPHPLVDQLVLSQQVMETLQVLGGRKFAIDQQYVLG